MFDLETFYEECNSGEKVDLKGIREYINSFDRVIIWGAAGLGQAIGRLLEAWGVSEIIYWDQRCEEIGPVGNRRIEKPFKTEYDRNKTLVMYSIPNHVIMSTLMKDLREKGYLYVIRGDIFYSGTICPYCNGDRPSSKCCWMKDECRSVICKRLQSITKNRSKTEKPGERIVCNLNCMHCVQYINNYPKDRMINIPTEAICRDIDLWLELIDSVGTISVMGGETFVHPDIAKIAKKFSEHENFGFVSFPTNGLYPIKPEQLEGIEDERIVIAFGAYQHVANEKQLEIYRSNIELVKSYGISYTESRHLPTWVVPSGIYKSSDDEEYMRNKKERCLMPPRNLQIRDGKVHTCDRGVALYAMGVVDYPTDYYQLQEEYSLAERRENFRRFVNSPFYYTCGHCGTGFGEAPSAIQGKLNAFSSEDYVNQIWNYPIEK